MHHQENSEHFIYCFYQFYDGTLFTASAESYNLKLPALCNRSYDKPYGDIICTDAVIKQT